MPGDSATAPGSNWFSDAFRGVAAWYVFNVVAARAKGRGLQSAGVLVSEGDFGILPTRLHGPHIPAG